MIEVEKNFDLRSGDKEQLIERARFVARKSFTDIYYDTEDYRLTGRDFWLRSRDGKFELKASLNQDGIHERVTDQYKELESDEEIIWELGLEEGRDLAWNLASKGYKPFATIITNREEYQKGEFKLDFDEMDFGFTTFEVELMVNIEQEISMAENKIMEFAKKHDIASTAGHGKVIEYILRYNPKHYQALVDRGVVKRHK